MNQTSLSVSDVGKTNALLQTGSSDAKASSESDESSSFLSALGAIFQSETESTDETQALKADVSEAEVSAQSVDELVADETSTEGEEGDASDAKAESDSSQLSPSVASDESTSKSSGSEEKAAKTMNEGNELLGRLDESNQALKKEDGKSLPQDSKDSEQSLKNLEDDPAISRFIEKPTAKDQNTSGTEDVKVANQVSDESVAQSASSQEHSQRVASNENENQGYKAELAESELMSQSYKEQSNKVANDKGTAVVDEPMAIDPSQKEVVGQNSVSPQSEKALREQVMLSAELEGQAKQQVTDELVWRDAQVIATNDSQTHSKEPLLSEDELVNVAGSAALLSPLEQSSLDNRPLQSPSATAPVARVDRAQIEATMAQLNLNDVEIEDLSPEELEYLVQMSTANAMPEQLKTSPELVRPTAVATAAAQQLHTPQPLHQQAAQAQITDKAAFTAPIPTTAAELNHAQMQQAQPFNPTQFMAANNANSQQHMMKTAPTTGGVAGAMKAGDSDNKESGLSQQLSGLAGQQGLQQTQIKADMQQAVQQSPLQLSRDVAGEKLSEQVQMMLSKNLKNIDIRLDPPELGRMQIRMSMNGDTAAVQFTVANQQAKDIVDQAMPRLREMLAQQGIQLSDSSVHQQSSGQQQGQYASNDANNKSGLNGLSGDGDVNVDESINLDVNIKSKDDGISFYA
ncbi:flagellar hook-length control protein FliK [Vibrio algarum]|uniref:Flagellar hook-length control protein FliK n=1 Tax=Vibrio algarum TaxID=3020714 RepID=A0ABT4YP41_9VIBR|nr:flagellar hook-length control protein FliK [Vibrio sp. KJ40-1]MDB1123304.1 flagellar hook-length control protein FliK [Vibrio sp. KJ40-1]